MLNTNHRSTLFTLFIVLGPALSPAAEPATPGNTSARDAAARAQAYIDVATNAFEARQFGLALEALTMADPLLEGDPAQAAVRFNIARCYEEMKRPTEAIAAYERYLAGPDSGARRSRAESALAALRPTWLGHLVVRCYPVGTSLALEADGRRRLIDCPFAEELPVGKYTLIAQKSGFVSAYATIDVLPRGRHEQNMVLAPLATASPAPAASHRPVSTASRWSDASAGRSGRKISPTKIESDTTWIWLAAGAGAVATVGGVFLNVATLDARDRVPETPRGTVERTDAQAEFESLRIATVATYLVGLAGLGTGLWLALRAPNTTPAVGLASGPGGIVVRF